MTAFREGFAFTARSVPGGASRSGQKPGLDGASALGIITRRFELASSIRRRSAADEPARRYRTALRSSRLFSRLIRQASRRTSRLMAKQAAKT